MNVGQVLETHLGWAAGRARLPRHHAGVRRRRRHQIEDALGRAWLAEQADAIEPGISVDRRPTGARTSNVPAMEAWLKEQGLRLREGLRRDHASARRSGPASSSGSTAVDEKVKRNATLRRPREDCRRRGAQRRRIAAPIFGKQTHLRRPHRRAVRPAGDRRPHLHAQARPPGRGQDPRPLAPARTR